MSSLRPLLKSPAARPRRAPRNARVWPGVAFLVVPWFNALVIVVLLLVVHAQLVITPGVIFELPAAPLREGSRPQHAALMIAVPHEQPWEEETLIFFDEERFSLSDEEQMTLLAERLHSSMALSEERELLLLADRRVAHGAVMRFVNLAREAGVTRVNVAEKTE